MNTPWGPSQSRREIAPGIYNVTTASHGGMYLSEERLVELLRIFPHVKTWAGIPWFEEDCDWAYVALAFPAAFDDYTLEIAVRMAERGDYLKLPMDVDLEHWHAIGARVEAFRASVADKWEVGSMGSGGKGWSVNVTRGAESKWVPFAQYPAQCYYTDAELEAATDAGAKVEVSNLELALA